MSLVLRFAARSHTGLLREGNEDSVYAGPRVLAVADGMGGHAAGEVASAVAIAALAHLDEDVPGNDLLDVLRACAESANEHLRDMVSGDPALEGMGTTITAFLFAGNRLGMLHIGDSRAYLLRDGNLGQISHDHTLVQALVDEGRISEEEASTHPQRSLITRALDGRDGIEPDLSVREVRVGDRYLLCTDGLTGPVGRLKTLQEALQIADPQKSCDRLVQLALRGGGPDNVTVIVADVIDAAAGQASAPVVAGAAAASPQPPPDGIDGTAAARARTAEGRDDTAPRRTSVAPLVEVGRGRRLGRTAVATAVVLSLLAVGAGSTFAYVRSQYYVGLQDEQVAVFRGITGSVAGLRLSSVQQTTGLSRERLDRIVLNQLTDGIVAADRSDAASIVNRLEQRFPECDPEPTAVPTPRPSPTSTPVATSGPIPSPALTPPPAPALTPPPAPAEDEVPCP